MFLDNQRLVQDMRTFLADGNYELNAAFVGKKLQHVIGNELKLPEGDELPVVPPTHVVASINFESEASNLASQSHDFLEGDSLIEDPYRTM